MRGHILPAVFSEDRMRKLFWLAMMCAVAVPAMAQDTGILYKASLIQAAPGKLLELIDLEKKMLAEAEKSAGDAAPVWMRHSQGDRWDLLILYPVGSYSDYYEAKRSARRQELQNKS